MFDLSAIQILIVLGIALLVVGPKRLPEMGRGLGRGLRGFKDSIAGKDDEPDSDTQQTSDVPVVVAAASDRPVVVVEDEPAKAATH